jgi:hypothetical protein
MPVTIGAAYTAGLDEAAADDSGLGEAESVGGADSLAAGCSDPEAAASPLDTVTTAVTVRRVPVSEEQAETASTPVRAAANTR